MTHPTQQVGKARQSKASMQLRGVHALAGRDQLGLASAVGAPLIFQFQRRLSLHDE